MLKTAFEKYTTIQKPCHSVIGLYDITVLDCAQNSAVAELITI